MNFPYRISYQPQLIEAAVLYAISGQPEERVFRSERDQLYDDATEERESAFQNLHHRWFNRLGLGIPLRETLEQWPILIVSTHCCILMKARSPKEVGAELYLAPQQPLRSERERRTIIIQLLPELLGQRERLLPFFRHELLHIMDMVDPSFGYQPDFPTTTAGPAHNRLLQERYTVLWDITIDGRLHQQGWASPQVREKHRASFKRVFSGDESQLEMMFSFFFGKSPHTHHELMLFAQNPEGWLGASHPGNSSKGRCALCHFPSFHLLNPSLLSDALVSTIQEHNPAVDLSQPICQQCADLYETRASSADFLAAR